MSASEQSHTTRCYAPCKLILSGEHAVLYHSPALSMAIDLQTQCFISQNPAERASIHIQLDDFDLQRTFSFSQWQQQAQQIEQRFTQFQNSELGIEQVLSSPFDLVLMTLWVFHQQQPIQTAIWQIQLQSEVPIGRGLGSSAAVIVSLLSGLFKQHQQSVDKEKLLQLAKQVESYQHGRSSGLDPATLIYGGLLKYQLDQPIQPLPTQPITGWLIDSGAPQSHTGECVQAVKQHYQYNDALWAEFKKTATEIEQAWSQQNQPALKQAVRDNHRLLSQIGVVPQRVQNFIEQLEQQLDAACKVCGAGSVTGDSAGMLLCLSAESPQQLCQSYGYRMWPLKLQTSGVQCELA